MEQLQQLVPIVAEYNYSKYTVLAWNDTVPCPYGDYPYPCPNDSRIYHDKMLLEINNVIDQSGNNLHRYSVIAHEYFHIYQVSRSGGPARETTETNWVDVTDLNNFIMWILEGPATLFECLYVWKYYNAGRDESFDARMDINEIVFDSPHIYENRTIDFNYCHSLFLTLVLYHELMDAGDSSNVALSKILFKFWTPNLQRLGWKSQFKAIFNIDIDHFYARIPNYRHRSNTLHPTSQVDLDQLVDL